MKKYILCSLATIVLFSILFFLKDSDIPDVQIENEGNTIGPITINNFVEQTFMSKNNGLSKIDLVLATYGRVNTSNVSFEVFDEQENIIFSQTINAANIQDNAVFSLKFDPIKNSSKKTYKIKILSDAQSDDNAITAWATVSNLYTYGDLYLNGSEIPFDIALYSSISSRTNAFSLFIIGLSALIISIMIVLISNFVNFVKGNIFLRKLSWIICSCFAAVSLTILYDRIVLDHFLLHSEFSSSVLLRIILILMPMIPVSSFLFFKRDHVTEFFISHDFFVVCLIFSFGVLLHFLFANIEGRFLSIYPDEYYYYDIARNIANGNGISATHFSPDFDKIVYPLVISPFFTIKDISIRMSVMAFVNSTIVMVSIFPLWLICKEINLSIKNTYVFLIIMSFWSDMICSMTFMSEILYWPLLLFFFYTWVLNSKRSNIKYSVIEGFLCYIGYMCKNVFLAAFIGYVVWEVVYPFFNYIITDKKAKLRIKYYYSKERIINCLIFIISFSVCNIAGQFIMSFTSSSENVSSLIFGLTPYTFGFFIYAVIYYLFAFMISVFICPFAFPASNFKSLDETTKKLYSYSIIVLLILIAIVSYTISIRETLGSANLRILYRYFSPIIPIIIICFLKTLQTGFDSSKNSKSCSWVIITLCVWLPCLVYSGLSTGSQSDQSLLNWYETLREHVGTLTASPDMYEINLYKIIIGIVLIALTFICFYLFTHNRISISKNIYLTIFISVGIFNNFTEYKENAIYDQELASDVISINNYLTSLPEKSNILYLSSDRSGTLQVVFDTYISDERFVYIAPYINFFDKGNTSYLYDIKNPDFYDLIDGVDKPNIDKIDYIIADFYADRYTKQLDGVEIIDIGCGEHYVLYKNINNKNIAIKDRTE